MGFFGFWALGIASSALTIFLESGPAPREGETDESGAGRA
jgi:hypothetical protein